MMTYRPLIGATLALAAGILLASFWPFSLWLLLTAFLFLGFLFFFTKRTLWGRIAFLSAFALLGLVHLLQSSQIPENDISRYAPIFISLTGVVNSEAEIASNRITGEPYTVHFDLDARGFEIRETNGAARSVSASGKVAVRIPVARNKDTSVSRNEHETQLPQYGDLVIVTGRLEIPDGPRNPGAFDYRAYLARQGIHATLIARRAQDWQVVTEPGFKGNLLTHLAFTLRQGVRNHTRRAFSLERAEVLNGILMGARENLPPALRDDFELTGTTHILATAGLHVGMVVVMLLWLLPRCGIPHLSSRLFTLLFLIVYAIMAGGRPSVVRAALMAGIYLFGLLLEREPDVPNAIALAGLILLAANPQQLFDAGFQMSFATVITLVTIMPLLEPLRHRLRESIHGDWPGVGAVRVGADLLASYFLLALGAQLGAAPFIVYTFHNVSLVSIITNTLVVPVMPLLLAFGFLACVLGTFAPLLAMPFDWFLNVLLAYIISVVRFSAHLPFANINVEAPAVALLCLYYGLLASGIALLRKRQQQNPLVRGLDGPSCHK